MPAYTAIAEAGMAIVELLRSQMTPEPISKPELIGLCLPYEPEDYQLTVYLYHIEQSAESQAGYVREGKTLQRLAPLTLNLNFLITAHSKAPVQNRAQDEYRIIGRAMQVIRDTPLITGDLLGASLAESGALLRVSISKLSLEQLQKIWNHTQKPYKLSFAVQCTVEIESHRTRVVGRVGDITITLDERTGRGGA